MPHFLIAQAVEKNTLVLGVKYYNDNNAAQHLVVSAKSKIDGKFQKIGNIIVKVYITRIVFGVINENLSVSLRTNT